MTDALSHIDSDGKDRLVKKIKVAAAAMADLWDELYEHEKDGEFDDSVAMVSELAGHGGSYPASYDRYDTAIWETLAKHWKPY
ncbi:hypothetical protein [Mesorhizobium sp. M7A.F.Ca.MR.362.00.0.0]|uniref:hypothetical protein n=1 Tax=Mesorhizobium sp. M7A.F.Ca.MR.362.00.0.0 TaxID=2496779 RepID=UPI000FD2951F|nr:hypothetical protein [Mesorhizobium sp. M7A.F.Ca.MR.362.00.0.0]RUU78222.1 hypothetical protein EOC06_20620 [Mesorhizobium sp. M7A.F.Ca.MR.362.00.0.0]RWN95412.1 MAG: hypothetical protein EOS05_11505 [Mesorhizobium sp.]